MIWNLLEAAAEETPKNNVGTIIIMAVLVVAIIGLFVWQSISGKKKQKEAQNMVNSIKIGDRIKTIGGVCGYLVEINDTENTIVIETGAEGNKSYIKFDKGAIYQTAPANVSAPAASEKPAEVKKEEVEATENKAEAVVDAAEKKEDAADASIEKEPKKEPKKEKKNKKIRDDVL